MSRKLEEILSSFYKFIIGADQNGLSKDEAKAQIKELMLKIIGKDEDFGEVRSTSETFKARGHRNELRAELRERIKSL